MDGTKAKRSKSPEHALSNYRMGKTLGVGAFGKVKVALHTLTGLKVAIKILDRQSINFEAAEKVRREINILRLLSHPHVVRLYEVIETRANIYMIMEYMNSGDLYDFIIENVRLEEDEARHFFQQIISGVEFCHLHKVVHRDLKPENLLLDSKCNVKIADFGLGNVTRDGHFLKTNCGSPNYAAPEVIAEQLYAGPEVDVWSSGVILYALLCGRLPFDDDNLPGLFAKIKNGAYTYPTHISHGANDLIARILVVDPVNRISIPEIHQHPWFQQHIPRYIAIRSPDILYNTEKIDEDIVSKMVKIGFDNREVVRSLHSSYQNEATVTYYLLLHNRFGDHCSYGSLPEECIGRPEIYVRSLPPVQKKWALGFKSQAPPHETLTNVLRVFESLQVRWKKIGHYNMKCLWLPPPSTYSKAMDVVGFPQGKLFHGLELSLASVSSIPVRSKYAVKFEIQLYKAGGELYVLDLQRMYGPPFLFLEFCSAFFALVVA
ncbi:hypothetical protein LguiB_004101 [Lonicera macranthoides]